MKFKNKKFFCFFSNRLFDTFFETFEWKYQFTVNVFSHRGSARTLEIHRQILPIHFGPPLEGEDSNKYQSFRLSKSGALQFQDVWRFGYDRISLDIFGWSFWILDLSACKQLMESMIHQHQHRYQCCNSPPWSLPWSYPTPHSPLSPEVTSSSGTSLPGRGARAEFS